MHKVGYIFDIRVVFLQVLYMMLVLQEEVEKNDGNCLDKHGRTNYSLVVSVVIQFLICVNY